MIVSDKYIDQYFISNLKVFEKYAYYKTKDKSLSQDLVCEAYIISRRINDPENFPNLTAIICNIIKWLYYKELKKIHTQIRVEDITFDRIVKDYNEGLTELLINDNNKLIKERQEIQQKIQYRIEYQKQNYKPYIKRLQEERRERQEKKKQLQEERRQRQRQKANVPTKKQVKKQISKQKRLQYYQNRQGLFVGKVSHKHHVKIIFDNMPVWLKVKKIENSFITGTIETATSPNFNQIITIEDKFIINVNQ